MDAFVDALRCGLTGQVMVDPVIVWTDSNPALVCGGSYERSTLEQWLAERGDAATRFGPNVALKGMIGLYCGAKVL
jgi:hypothetical protein